MTESAEAVARTPPIVLCFAASDPSGGAGIQADLLTVAALACHPVTVVTGITVQDTAGIEAVLAIDSEWVDDQARRLLEDVPVRAFKVGVSASVENIASIAEIVSDYPDVPLVVDTVLASGRGDELATGQMIEALTELLLPFATLVTPNSIEARRLAGEDGEADTSLTLARCAERLIDLGAEYVLIKGTHENTPTVDNTLYDATGPIRTDSWPRLPGSYHGSGCTLAAAIAAYLARGLSVVDAVAAAQAFTYKSLQGGFRPGMGQYLPDRFFWAQGLERP